MDPGGPDSDAGSQVSEGTARSHATSQAASRSGDGRARLSGQSGGKGSAKGGKPAEEKESVETLPLWRYLQDEDWEGAKEFIKDPSVEVNIADETFGWTPLLFAANYGAVSLYKRLTEVKAKADACCREGNTALMLACRRGHLQTAEYIISKKANLDQQNKNGWSALIWSSINGHEEVATMLLAAQANYISCDIEGRSACMWAAKHGHLGMVEAFLACGLNLSIKDKAGLTVLDHAAEQLEMRSTICAMEEVNRGLVDSARRHDTEGVRHAIEAGADLDMRDAEGFSALMWAALNNSLDMVELVVRHGANPSLLIFYDPDTGESKHMEVGEAVEAILGSNDRLLAAATEGHWEGVEDELKMGAFINVQDEKKRTALMWAARHSAPQFVETLVSKNALIDDRDSSGWAAVHFAVAAKSAETVSMLNYLGADFAPRTYEGDTLLHMATRANDSVTIQVLLAAKSNIEEVDVDEHTALLIACINGLGVSVRTLLAFGASIQVADEDIRGPAAVAVVNRQPTAIEALLQHPKPPQALPGEVVAEMEKKSSVKQGGKATSKAAGKSAAKAEAKSKANAKSAGGSKGAGASATGGVLAKKKIITRTGPEKKGDDAEALLRSAIERKPEILKKNKDPVAKAVMKQPDKDGYTPLALAVINRNESMVTMLLAAKADVHAVNSKGNSVLFEAVATKQRLMVEKLLELNAKVDAKNKQGQKPIDICEDEVIRQMLNRRVVEAKIPPSEAPAEVEEEAVAEDKPKKAKKVRFRVRVESLPPKHTEAELKKAVKQKFIKLGCGVPERVQVPLDPITYVPLGHAFVDFSNAAMADLAVRGDGGEISGYQVRVFKEVSLRTELGPVVS